MNTLLFTNLLATFVFLCGGLYAGLTFLAFVFDLLETQAGVQAPSGAGRASHLPVGATVCPAGHRGLVALGRVRHGEPAPLIVS